MLMQPPPTGAERRIFVAPPSPLIQSSTGSLSATAAQKHFHQCHVIQQRTFPKIPIPRNDVSIKTSIDQKRNSLILRRAANMRGAKLRDEGRATTGWQEKKGERDDTVRKAETGRTASAIARASTTRNSPVNPKTSEPLKTGRIYSDH